MSDEWFGSRVCMSAHRTCHRLKRSRSTLSPRLEASDMKVMTACRFRGCFPRKVAIAYCTLRRHLWWRWKEVRLFCMSPTHWIILVLGALALRSTFDHLRTPFSLHRNCSWSPWSRIRCMNTTCRATNGTFVFTWCTGVCHPRARGSYRRGRTRRAGRTRVRAMWHETMGTKESCDGRWDI
jgi:hypothetical protein